MDHVEQADEFSRLIGGLLGDPDVERRVQTYLDPTGQYAATTFDLVGNNDPYKITEDDVLSVSFLDTPIRASAYRRMVNKAGEITDLLLRIDSSLCLWDLTETSDAYAAANELWVTLDAMPGMGRTRVSKLLARKRPHLIPIRDRRVDEFFGKTRSFWIPLAMALHDEALRVGIASLRPDGVDARLSILRLLDIAIWMTGRESPPGTASEADHI